MLRHFFYGFNELWNQFSDGLQSLLYYEDLLWMFMVLFKTFSLGDDCMLKTMKFYSKTIWIFSVWIYLLYAHALSPRGSAQVFHCWKYPLFTSSVLMLMILYWNSVILFLILNCTHVIDRLCRTLQQNCMYLYVHQNQGT